MAADDRQQTHETDYAARELDYNAFMAPALSAAIASALPRAERAPGRRGLDLGCGPGGLLAELHAIGGATIVGLDLSGPHLRSARQRIAARRLRAVVRLVAADLRAPLPFADDAFDWAWAADVLWPDITPDPIAVTRELGRVVRPGGVIAIFFGNWLRAAFLPGYARLEHLLSAATELCCFRRRVRPAAHHESARGWLRAAGIAAPSARSFLVQHQHPLTPAVRRYVQEVIFAEYSRPEVERRARQLGLTATEWAEWRTLSDPASPRFLLDQPDYRCFQVGELSVGRVAAAGACDWPGIADQSARRDHQQRANQSRRPTDH